MIQLLWLALPALALAIFSAGVFWWARPSHADGRTVHYIDR